MTPERLDKIREHFTGWTSVDDINNVRYAQDLIAHIDHLTAENARLRGRLDDVRDYAEYRRLHSGICRDILNLLNPPTEGENSE